MRKRNILIIFTFLACFAILTVQSLFEDKYKGIHDLSYKDSIEMLINTSIEDGNIPGMSVAVNCDGDSFIKSYGYSDIDNKIKVNNNSIFEIGSNSKAFTAYAIFALEDEGKINLDDPISKYIEGLEFKFKGEYQGEYIDQPVNITIKNLLNHTSGLSNGLIVSINEDESEDALDNLMKSLNGLYLNNYPGEEYEYSTVNYDILGRIIEIVSGMSYKDYMCNNVFKNLKLDNTTFNSDSRNKTKGYKSSFFGNKEYDAPIYKGNYPAGYIESSIIDMNKWIKLIMNDQNHIINELINPNRNNLADENSFYANGWFVRDTTKGQLIYHGGNNPNYSSFIVINKKANISICILANKNSPYVETLAMNIYNYLTHDELIQKVDDTNNLINNISRIAICLLSILLVFILFNICKKLKEIRICKIQICNSRKKIILFFNFILIEILINITLIFLPKLLLESANWKFAVVWMPYTFPIAAIVSLIVLSVFNVYYLINCLYKSDSKDNLFAIAIFSIVSGLGNSVVIFVINSSVNDMRNLQLNYLLYFIIGMLVYVLGQKIVRKKLIEITNNIIYKKRMDITKKILSTRYDQFEKIDDGEIQCCLNNDTEVISNFSNIIITGATCLVTIICCFIYLAIISKTGFFVAMWVIFIAVAMYFFVTQRANISWEKARTSQNEFFALINDLLLGFKELNISLKKKCSFLDDVETTCREYTDRLKDGGYKFATSFVVGESLFTFVIGFIVFTFPLIVSSTEKAYLSDYVFVFLYITGPINGVLNAIPNLIHVKISWNRINELLNKIDKTEKINNKEIDAELLNDFNYLTLDNINYEYENNEDNHFKVGPISAQFKKGDISFIIGGNGSGKSTLIKIITGLYKSKGGFIKVNDKEIDYNILGQLSTVVYSDFYLFKKLYGLNIKTKDNDKIESYLKMLKLSDKVTINANEFSTVKLSTGQRKRLALLVSYLEDKPIFIFDEWAADQDPEYRKFFYLVLLPELKKRGKCVIAITHDDRYFDVADQVLKMELGTITQIK